MFILQVILSNLIHHSDMFHQLILPSVLAALSLGVVALPTTSLRARDSGVDGLSPVFLIIRSFLTCCLTRHDRAQLRFDS